MVSACRLTIARCTDSPASPNSACAIGMPSCTVLPKVIDMARTEGAAGWNCGARDTAGAAGAPPAGTACSAASTARRRERCTA